MKKAVIVICSLFTTTSLWAQQKRPNIVWITTEDNSAHWYRLYNPEGGAPMPNVEKLAANGLVFNNAYSNAPVCSAARSTIISGLYGSKTGAHFHRSEEKVQLPEGLDFFPKYLRDAGYYTTNNSKTDYNYTTEHLDEVWNECSGKASYRNRAENQPFFHVQNFGDTHEGRLFPDLAPDISPIIDPSEVQLLPYHPDTETFRKKYAQYLTINHHVDKKIGKIIDQLESDGLLDDTFIFHYGDHGGVLPGSKGYANNDGLQVAMVVYVPKNWKHLVPAKEGSRIDGFVEFVDLSATVLKLAGIAQPKQLDGKPFLGEGITLEQLNQRDEAFGYADRFDEKYDMVRFLRKGKYTYRRNYQAFNFDGLYNEYRYKQEAFQEWKALAETNQLDEVQMAFYKSRVPEQLYDLENDPHEIHNLANDPAYQKILLKMRANLQKRVKSMPDLSFYPEPMLLEESQGNAYAFGQTQKRKIQQLIDVADVQLLPYKKARKKIEKALNSDDPLVRYWALIDCSTFGKEASEFHEKAKELAKADPHILVRTRAAEFLGLTDACDPKPYLLAALNECDNSIEANLILNTVVLLCENSKMHLDISTIENSSWAKLDGILVPPRVAYLKKLAEKEKVN